MKEIGWNNSLLINSFIKLLNCKLKASLVGMELLMPFSKYITVSML
jgi:hypothetical protein